MKAINIHPRRIAVDYKFYTPRKYKVKQWVEPATLISPLILLGKNKPVGKNITLTDIYNNKPTPEQKK